MLLQRNRIRAAYQANPTPENARRLRRAETLANRYTRNIRNSEAYRSELSRSENAFLDDFSRGLQADRYVRVGSAVYARVSG